MKFSPVDDGGKAGDENAGCHRDDMGVRVGRAVGRVKGPARIDAAVDERPEREGTAENKDIPAHQIQSRESDIARADHQRNDKVPEHGRNGGNKKKPNHEDAVDGEKLVVSLRSDQVALRGEQFDAHHRGGHTRDREEENDRPEIEKPNPLMIGREKPGANAMVAA